MKCALLLLAAAVVGSAVAFNPRPYGPLRQGAPVPMPRRTLAPSEELPSEPRVNIIGGHPANQGDIPYQAAVVIDDNWFCSGSLISNRHVVTSAHCAYNQQSFIVCLGATRLSSPESGHVIIRTFLKVVHENFRADSMSNDIALLDLQQNVNFNHFIRSISLATGSSSYVGRTATVSGWGSTSSGSGLSDRLNYIKVTVMSNDQCGRVFGVWIPEDVVCTESSVGASCNGDNGGPLVDDSGRLMGIVSFFTKGCGARQPEGFARVSSFTSWIRRHGGLGDYESETSSFEEADSESLSWAQMFLPVRI